MSPELVKKMSYNGAKADIWALGVTMYLMLIGKYPFRATSEQ
jgi:serine/threonine protein kinase